jgi:putative serine protease PepD
VEQVSTGSPDPVVPRRRRSLWALLAVTAAVLAIAAAVARSGDTSVDSGDGPSTTTTTEVVALTPSEIYEVVEPSMVIVRGGDQTLGSGTIVSADGSVLTARHVISDAASIELVFADGTRTSASVASSNAATDSALLTPHALPEVVVPAVLGGGIEVGSSVVAVGHPFGLTNSLSDGVVSGLGRAVTAENGQRLADLIQFDAAVNPGNSGGPLLNDRGEVVGVVTALANPSDDTSFIGIGFAVPVLTAIGGGGAPVPQ